MRELEKPSLPQDERDRRFVLLNSLFKSANTSLNARRAEENQRLTALREQRKALENKIAELRKNRLTFPVNTTKLRSKIAEEFEKRSIDSEVRVFADLIEIDLPEWQDAVEGYLAAQRFNIIVEPRYYDIAADVYNRVKSQIEGVILVNTQPLELTRRLLRIRSRWLLKAKIAMRAPFELSLGTGAPLRQRFRIKAAFNRDNSRMYALSGARTS